MQGNFIPDWKIYSDVAWVNLSYKTYVRNPDNSYALNDDGSRKQIQKYATPLRIILKADMTGVEGIHKIEVEKLYSNYPEYFINYLDIEE